MAEISRPNSAPTHLNQNEEQENIFANAQFMNQWNLQAHHGDHIDDIQRFVY